MPALVCRYRISMYVCSLRLFFSRLSIATNSEPSNPNSPLPETSFPRPAKFRRPNCDPSALKRSTGMAQTLERNVGIAVTA